MCPRERARRRTESTLDRAEGVTKLSSLRFVLASCPSPGPEQVSLIIPHTTQATQQPLDYAADLEPRMRTH